MENTSAGLAALRRDEADVKEMEKALEKMLENMNKPYKYTKHDLNFNKAIISPTKNDVIKDLIKKYGAMHLTQVYTISCVLCIYVSMLDSRSWQRVNRCGLLNNPIKKLTSRPRSPAVETEGELVQVVIQVRYTLGQQLPNSLPRHRILGEDGFARCGYCPLGLRQAPVPSPLHHGHVSLAFVHRGTFHRLLQCPRDGLAQAVPWRSAICATTSTRFGNCPGPRPFAGPVR